MMMKKRMRVKILESFCLEENNFEIYFLKNLENPGRLGCGKNFYFPLLVLVLVNIPKNLENPGRLGCVQCPKNLENPGPLGCVCGRAGVRAG